MKQKTFQKKVTLNKETIANLNDSEMSKVAAGVDDTKTTCITDDPGCRISYTTYCERCFC